LHSVKKLALLFVLAIFAPALLLGVLAIRTAGRQRMIMQQQEVELRQKETDELAEKVRTLLTGEQRTFLDAVDRLRARVAAERIGRDFSSLLPGEWSRDCIGFAVDSRGVLLSPTMRNAPDAATRDFLRDNAAFLGSQTVAEVYQPNAKVFANAQFQNSQNSLNNFSSSGALNSLEGSMQNANVDRAAASNENQSDQLESLKDASKGPPVAAAAPASRSTSAADSAIRASAGLQAKAVSPADKSDLAQIQAGELNLDSLQNNASQNSATLNNATQKYRSVAPQNQQLDASAYPVSQLNSATSRFAQLVADGHDGILARYVEDELVVIFWVRSTGDDQSILGAQIKASKLFDAIQPGLEPFSVETTPSRGRSTPSSDVCLAILDDRVRPAAVSIPGFTASWKTPFVATEIGEVLPHWEAALYLVHPDAISNSARLITLTLYAIVGLAVAAIGWGSILIATDARRQLVLAQKKTDFVSNVSHELKTPLTSIRMFAELLQERRVTDPAKTADYLRIIRLEAERLTRLINNVLDFARFERNQQHYTPRLIDLHPQVGSLWEAQAEHLRSAGFDVSADTVAGPWWCLVDPDAITQILLNLLSNSEKYSAARKEIALHAIAKSGALQLSILDRGSGIPSGAEEKIFESFYRAHDSLSNGIPGSGLGLTLARRIAREHGGDIRFERRPGGGSIFTLIIPLHEPPSAA
jgi:signal transduction histidine kinase